MPNIPGLDSIDWGGYLGVTLTVVGYILLTVGIFAALFVFYILWQYKYKVTIMQRGGKGDEEDKHSIGKILKDRAREFKDKNGIVKWKFLFSRKKIPPVEYKHIYPGRNVYLYQSAPGSFFPFKLAVSNPSATFEGVPHDVNLWSGLELREAAIEYQKKGFWEQYGSITIMMGTVLFCLILVGVVIYFTYEHANGVQASLGGLTDTLKNINTIPGR